MNNEIPLLPISAINILNPRSRNKNVFEAIINNIGKLGLKKPIIVSKRDEPLAGKEYDLVCGQGRLEAYAALGHAEIPCVIVPSNVDDRYLMSIIENIARRHYTSVELVREIADLRQRGYSTDQISAKLDLDRTYIFAIQQLLDHGEEALITEVERGRIPVGVALRISNATDQELRGALREAYTSGELKGQQLLAVKRFLTQRRAQYQPRSRTKPLSAKALVRAYKHFTSQHERFVRQAARTEERLLLIVTAFKRLLADENFVTLLRAEGLPTMPQLLAERIQQA